MSRPVFPKAAHLGKRNSLDMQNGKSGTDSKVLSFQELHKELQARLHKQGIINDMRAELRNRLVHELYEIAEPEEPQKVLSGEKAESQLPLQISNWLVCNHFQRGKFEFTLSTFLRESGIVTLPEFSMTFHDVLYIFGIHPNTAFYKSIQDKYSSEKNSGGLLFLIVQELLLCVFPQSKKGYGEAFTQTDNSVTNEEKAHRKVLEEIEYLREKLDQELTNVLSEKRDLVKKDFVCMSCNKDVQDSLSLLDQQKKEISRLETLLKSTEKEVKRQKEALEEELLLKAREIENKIWLQWQKREGEFRTTQIKLSDEKRIKEEEILLEEVRSNFDKSQLKVRDLESHVQITKEQLVILQKQNKSLQAMVESMADYEVIKSDLNVTKRELELALSRYQDAQNQWLNIKEMLEKKVAELTLKITSPCLELLSANTEVQKMLEKQEQDLNSWNQERSQWQREINQAKIRILEQKQHIENQNKVIYNLQLQNSNFLLGDSQNDIIFPNRKLSTPSIPSKFSPPKPAFSKDSSSSTLSSQSRTSYLQEAKNRIEKLQAEADTLERKYTQCLKNQRTLFSPAEAFFSPLLNSRSLLADISFPNTSLTFASEDGNFLSKQFDTTAPNRISFDDKYLIAKNPEYLTERNEPTDPITISTAVGGIQPAYCANVTSLNSNFETLQNPTSKISNEGNSVNGRDNASTIVSSLKGIKTTTEIYDKLDDQNTSFADTSQKYAPLNENSVTENLDISHKLNPANETLNQAEQPLERNTASISYSEPKFVKVSESSVPVKLDERTRSNDIKLKGSQVPSETNNIKSKLHETPSLLSEVNLDTEWRKVASITPAVSMPKLATNVYTVDLDHKWRRLSSDPVAASSHPMKIPDKPSKVAENIPASGNAEVVVVHNVGTESLPNSGAESGEHTVSDMKGGDMETRTVLPSVDNPGETEATSDRDSVFVPNTHSTPTVPAVSQQDSSKNSENGKVSSDIDLSIGDQKLQSANSGSESPW